MISIIICTRNRSESLARTLESIRQLSSPEDTQWELVIVDNNSADHTKAVVENFSESSGLNVRYSFEARKGLSFARNTGMRSARGEILVFTDDDMLPDKEWLANIARETSEHPSISLYLGQTKVARPGSPKIAIREGDSEKSYKYPCSPAEIGAGNNMIFRKQIVSAIGEFDTDLGAGSDLRAGEDTDFSYRIVSAGGEVRYFPQILAYHDHDRLDPKAIRAINYNYAIGIGGFYCKHIFKRDLWVAKNCYWDIRNFFLALFRKGMTVRSMIRLVGMMKGLSKRSAMEIRARLKKTPENPELLNDYETPSRLR